VGPGLSIDTERYFVVCANVLGGCQGSTGPASADPATGRAYGSTFPVITIRDMVRLQARLADHLGVERWLSVLGGSMGGMQVLEWGITYPDRVRSLVPIATCAQATAQQIAWGAIGRRSFRLDPRWRGGDYYDAAPGDGPTAGLGVARRNAHLTYRSEYELQERFSNDPQQGEDPTAGRRYAGTPTHDHQGATLPPRRERLLPARTKADVEPRLIEPHIGAHDS